MDTTLNGLPQAALLLVYTDNGSELPEGNFNKWYDEEHVPQRILFPGCTNASRYRSIDSKHPPWVALYHTISPEIPESREWYQLNEQASDTEKFILETIPTLARSIYTLSFQHLHDLPQIPVESKPNSITTTAQTTFTGTSTGAGKVICIVHLQVTPSSTSASQANLETELSQWYRNFVIQGVSTTPGWLRATMYKRYSGKNTRSTLELKVAMESGMLVIHEWNEEGDALEISKLESNVTAQVEIWEKDNSCKVTRETRIFSLYKQW